MKEIVKQVQSIKVKSFLIAIIGIILICWLYSYSHVKKDIPSNLSEKSVEVQKKSLDLFLSVFQSHKVPLLLFDIDILPGLFLPRPKSWHLSKHKCKILCKDHPEDKNVITFAIQGSNFKGKDRIIMQDLRAFGYLVYLSMDIDPRPLAKDNTIQLIPTYLWVGRNDHVIRTVFLHERLGSYMWIGPVQPNDWTETVNTLVPALSDGKNSMTKIAAKFPTYAQAFDKSTRFLGLPIEIDGYKVNVPYHIRAFLDEYKSSHFIECQHERAREYKEKHERLLTSAQVQFKTKARSFLLKVKVVLDRMKIPFWLTSGTCLGWYRQCDIIPTASNIDFGILIYDYDMKILEEMHDQGLNLAHKYGKADNSLRLVFVGEENIKANLIFFYVGMDHYWTGAAQAHDGQRFKYKFPRFELCWTEFVEIKLKVPCDPDKYIEAYYGKHWFIPKNDWKWNKHPPNMEKHGKWSESEMKIVIQTFEKNEHHHDAIAILRNKLKDKVIDLPHEIDKEISKLRTHRKKVIPEKEDTDKVAKNEEPEAVKPDVAQPFSGKVTDTAL